MSIIMRGEIPRINTSGGFRRKAANFPCAKDHSRRRMATFVTHAGEKDAMSTQ